MAAINGPGWIGTAREGPSYPARIKHKDNPRHISRGIYQTYTNQVIEIKSKLRSIETYIAMVFLFILILILIHWDILWQSQKKKNQNQNRSRSHHGPQHHYNHQLHHDHDHDHSKRASWCGQRRQNYKENQASPGSEPKKIIIVTKIMIIFIWWSLLWL